ncbi:hypothetical protein ACLMJK_004529 [Lecanora helva]
MHSCIISLFLLFCTCAQHGGHATKLSQREYQRFTNTGLKVERQERKAGNLYINIVKGIFNSDKGNLIQNVASIPCDTIQTLESDADEAEDFVNQIQAGEVPSIITNLPEEAISGVVSVVGDVIAVATEVEDIAEAAVTDVVNLFNDIEDGSIVSVIESIPSDIEAAITNGWNDFTDEVKTLFSDITCFFEGGCPSSSSAGFCSMPASVAATTTSDTAAAAYTSEFYASESSQSAAAAYTAEYYSSYYAAKSSESAAAAYTSEFYASESSESAAAAYTAEYYSSYYSESSAAAASSSALDVSVSTQSAATASYYVSENSAATAAGNTPSETLLQGTTPTAAQNPTPPQVQTTAQMTSQPTVNGQTSSTGVLPYALCRSDGLVVVLFAIFGLVLWL